MKAAVLVIDLVNDLFEHKSELAERTAAMLPALNRFLREARTAGQRVVFCTDSFLSGDFIFQGRMKEHAIRGTRGAEIAAGLEVRPEDTRLPKRRFSAFFKTDLDQTLRLWGVDTVGVCGVATNYCVLATALDALANDFRAVILEDFSVSFSEEAHRSTLDHYRHNPLFPLFQVMTGNEFLRSLAE